MFADDFVLLLPISQLADATKLQHDVNSIAQHCEDNGLVINCQKTKLMSFGERLFPTKYFVRNEVIAKVDEFKYLGVWFDPQLKFEKQVKETSRRVWAAWWPLIRRFRGASLNCKARLAKIYIQPIIDYGNVIYLASKKNISQIEGLQSQVLRGICYRPNSRVSYRTSLESCRFSTVENRLVRKFCKFGYNISRHLAARQLQSQFTVREGFRVDTVRYRYTESKQTAIVRIPRLWLSLPNSIKSSASLSSFLNNLDQHIVNFNADTSIDSPRIS